MAPKKKQNQHISQSSSFGELLAQFVTAGDNLSTFTDRDLGMSISPARLNELDKPSTKKKTKQSRYDGIDVEHGSPSIEDDSFDDILPSDEDIDYDDSFDNLIETAFQEDENVAMRNNLISLGRKYAVKGMEEASESSEVNRAFAKQEQALEMLMEEMDVGAAALDKDIEQLRMSRTKSYKALSDMAAVRASMYNGKLAIIKQMGAITKDKYDLAIKLKKDSNADATDNGMAATQAVQRLLSVGRQNLVGDDDDRFVSSGDDSPAGANYDDGRPETALHLAADIPPAESDGDKFIEHEGEGVEFVLDINSEDDRKVIYAVNKYGEIVEDYPLPSNQDQLSFQYNELAGEATDQLQRRYRLRRDGEDIVPPSMDD